MLWLASWLMRHGYRDDAKRMLGYSETIDLRNRLRRITMAFRWHPSRRSER